MIGLELLLMVGITFTAIFVGNETIKWRLAFSLPSTERLPGILYPRNLDKPNWRP